MKRRRTGRWIVAAVVALGVVAVAGSAATGRLAALPALTRAWGTIASSVAHALPSSSSSPGSSSSSSAAGAGASASSGAGGSAGSSAGSGASGGDAGLPHRQSGPLSKEQLSAPLVNGAFVTACGAPDDMKVVVDVAVRYGRAVTVKVKTTPPNLMVSSCIDRATRDLQWDVSPKTGHATVTY
jgi:hypothetical protein